MPADMQAERVKKRKKDQREKGKLKKPNLKRGKDGILEAVSRGINEANKDTKRKR